MPRRLIFRGFASAQYVLGTDTVRRRNLSRPPTGFKEIGDDAIENTADKRIYIYIHGFHTQYIIILLFTAMRFTNLKDL